VNKFWPVFQSNTDDDKLARPRPHEKRKPVSLLGVPSQPQSKGKDSKARVTEKMAWRFGEVVNGSRKREER